MLGDCGSTLSSICIGIFCVTNSSRCDDVERRNHCVAHDETKTQNIHLLQSTPPDGQPYPTLEMLTFAQLCCAPQELGSTSPSLNPGRAFHAAGMTRSWSDLVPRSYRAMPWGNTHHDGQALCFFSAFQRGSSGSLQPSRPLSNACRDQLHRATQNT